MARDPHKVMVARNRWKKQVELLQDELDTFNAKKLPPLWSVRFLAEALAKTEAARLEFMREVADAIEAQVQREAVVER